MPLRRLVFSLAAATLLAGCGSHGLPVAARATAGSLAARATGDDLAAAGDEALRILRKNTHTVQVTGAPRDRQVVFAGGGHFGSLWARDGMYACLGLLAAGDTAVVHDCLTTLLDGQRPDGLVPRRIGNGSNAVGILRSAVGLPVSTSTDFKTVDFSKPSVDTNPLVALVAARYIEQTGDDAFVARYRPALERAADWLHAQERDGLLVQDAYADWKDMVARGGKVMYSNALYYGALKALETLEDRAGDATRAAEYRTRAADLAAHVQAAFWDANLGYFRDTTELASFSPDGNLFAVWLGLATPEQTGAIFRRCDALLTLQPLLPALDGDYPASMIPVELRMAGIPHYHDRFEWPWLTSLYALAAAKAGDRERAGAALGRVAHLALAEGTFGEIYEGTQPTAVRTRFYQSETDFSWSAGMYLNARSALDGR